MQSKQYFTKIKNYPHEKSTEPEILQHISGGMKNPLSSVKVGLALRKAGFEQLRVAGKRGYRVVMYSCEEVNRNRHAMGRFTEAAG